MESHLITSHRAVIYPDRNSKDISKRFHKAGPSARLCLEYDPEEIAQLYADRKLAMKYDTTRKFIDVLVNEGGELRMGDISRRICVVRRSSPKTSPNTFEPVSPEYVPPFVVEPISVLVRHQLLVQLWSWEEQDRTKTIEHLSWAQVLAG